MHNIFRLLGDATHLITVVGLLCHIWRKGSAVGISAKTQLLFSMVFTTRYIDLFIDFISVYNSCMKVFYLAVTYVTTMSIYFKFTDTDTLQYDTFRCETLVFGSAIIAEFVHFKYTVPEVLWAFSEYLEVVAIIPQLYLISKAGRSEKVVDYYIYGLAQYRSFYIMNWVFRYYYEGTYDIISSVCGMIQTLIYFDYFFALFSSRIISKYQRCSTSDSCSKDPVYVISSNDLPPARNSEKKPTNEEKV